MPSQTSTHKSRGRSKTRQDKSKSKPTDKKDKLSDKPRDKKDKGGPPPPPPKSRSNSRSPPPPCNNCNVTPVVNCIDKIDATHCVAHWGYTSTCQAPVSVTGDKDKFTSGAPNQGQPAIFQPGTQSNVFTTPFDCTKTLTWMVNDKSDTADGNDTICKTGNRCKPSSAPDCAGVCGGTAVQGCDGVCCAGTTGKTCAPKDCAGVCGGTSQLDCNGVCNGTATLDCAGICCGGTTGKVCRVPDCSGDCDPNTPPKFFDCKGVCGGTGTPDCNGVCCGKATVDCAGTCCGGNTNTPCKVRDCAGKCDGKGYRDCGGNCIDTSCCPPQSAAEAALSSSPNEPKGKKNRKSKDKSTIQASDKKVSDRAAKNDSFKYR